MVSVFNILYQGDIDIVDLDLFSLPFVESLIISCFNSTLNTFPRQAADVQMITSDSIITCKGENLSALSVFAFST